MIGDINRGMIKSGVQIRDNFKKKKKERKRKQELTKTESKGFSDRLTINKGN